MKDSRINHYIACLKEARTDDAKKGMLAAILAEYSRSIVGRVCGDVGLIMDWLEEEVNS